jgi:hypothetical protein
VHPEGADGHYGKYPGVSPFSPSWNAFGGCQRLEEADPCQVERMTFEESTEVMNSQG